MIAGETVLSGAPHPGTAPEVMESGAGFYIGFRDTDGAPYCRESRYMENRELAETVLMLLRGTEYRGR